MTTQTNTFSFNADNLNMWNSDKSSWLWKLGDPYSVSGSIDTTSFSADYTLSATATIGANLTATGGSVDYGCDMTVNASLPSVVRSGECFVIDTSQWTAHSQLNTVSPNLSAEFYAAFGANASLSNIQIGPMGVASTDFSYSLPTQKYNFLDISSSSPDTTTSYGPFTVSGRLPVVSASGTGTTSVTAQDQSDSPILSASADLDRLVAMLAAKQSLAPQAKAAGLAYLLGDTNGNKDMLENTLGSEDGIHLDYTLFDTELTAALYAMQKFTFDITSVGVTMVSSYNGETVTGQLGDAFIFSTPATGNGAININASYTLNGTLRNDTGIVGNCTLDLTALNFDLAGAGPFNTTIPGFTTSFGEDAYTDLYSLYDNTQTYNALANATGSYIVNYSTTATAAGAGTLTSRPSQEQIEFNGTSGNDYLYGNALNNTINGYSGSDVIFAGDGNDTITVVANWNEGSGDTINGGAGTDSLTVDASTYNDPFYHANAIYWNGVDATGKELTAVGAGSSLVQIQTLLSNAVKLGLRGVGAGVTFSDIENLNLIASAVTSHDNSVYNSNDLLIVRGTGSYNGNIGTDTLYADWSAATQAITWNNAANTTTQTINGSSITGVERLLILSGSGNDNFSNTAVSTNDEFITGDGNDTINSGAGSDVINGGEGIDTSIYAAAAADYTIRHTTTAWTVQRNAEGQDTLSNVERLSFSDTRLALDLDGSAGAVAKILGAVFGRNSVSNTAYVGAGLNLLDNGMSNADLMQLVLKTKLGEGFSTTDEVALLYQNLFGQQPTTGTISQLSDLVNSGQFTQTSLAMLAANQDVNIANINLVGLAQTGLKYILV